MLLVEFWKEWASVCQIDSQLLTLVGDILWQAALRVYVYAFPKFCNDVAFHHIHVSDIVRVLAPGVKSVLYTLIR